MPVELIAALFCRVGGALEFAGNDGELHRQSQGGELALANIVVGDPNAQRRQAINSVTLGDFAGKAVQQTLAHHIVNGIIGALADGFAGLLKRITHVAERIHQFSLGHFPFHPLAVQRGNRQQKRESVDRQRNRKIIFPGPGNQFGDCLGKFTHSLSLHLRLKRGDVNITA